MKGSKRQHKKTHKKLHHKYRYVETRVYDGAGKSHVIKKERLKRDLYLKKGPKGRGLRPVDAKGHPIKIKKVF